MVDPDHLLIVYLHLARASDMRRQPMVRDKLLVLAGVTANDVGLNDISALCRQRILAHNAWHMVGRWGSLRDALEDHHFQAYLKQLRRHYSPEKAEHMLSALGIELARERDSYFSLDEYAAALMGTKLDEVPGILASQPAPARGNVPGRQGNRHADSTAARAGAEPSAGQPVTGGFRRLFADWWPFLAGLVALLALACAQCAWPGR